MDELAARSVACIRGAHAVFAGVGFALRSGGALVLTGPNGSGKSSLLRLIAGLGRVAGGTITWNGAAINAEPEQHAARIAYLGHNDAVKPALTVAANARLWTRLRGGTDAMADAALDRFGIAPLGVLPARLLSAGQRKRLALARATAVPTAVWLLDEPAAALDAKGVAALGTAIAGHRGSGGMVILSAHGDMALPDATTLDMAAFAAAPA